MTATTIVLAAGAYGSPAILQRSGVGDPADLEAAGIATVLELPGVGRNLHDHPLVELEFAGSERLRQRCSQSPRRRGSRPRSRRSGSCGRAAQSGPTTFTSSRLQRTRTACSRAGSCSSSPRWSPALARCPRVVDAGPDSTAPRDRPRLSHRRTRAHDRAVLAEGIERARELAATEPLRSMIGAELPSTSRAPDRTLPRPLLPSGRNMCDGCGSDPLAVCDGAGRVYGLEGVVVADCSLMPVIPRANTNVPAVLVGERIAETLL